MSDRSLNRATGRSTRMIEHAIKLSRQGRAVYVLAANKRHAADLMNLAGDILGSPENLGMKFETEASLGNFDWRSQTLRGAHPNCVVLVDHFTVEDKFRHIFDLASRYNAPSTPSGKGKHCQCGEKLVGHEDENGTACRWCVTGWKKVDEKEIPEAS